MGPSWRDAVLPVLGASRRRGVAVEKIAAAVRHLTTGHRFDLEFQDWLLETLRVLEGDGHRRLPRARHIWDGRTGLPQYVTAVRADKNEKKQAHRQTLADRPVPYARSQKSDHDPAQARQWLGRDLARIYLESADSVRWPQEGLTTGDIVAVLGKLNTHA